MRLGGFNPASMAEAARANLTRVSSQATAALRTSPLAAQFRAYSGQGMAKLHAGNGGLAGVSAKLRPPLARLQGKLMTQLQGRLGGPGQYGNTFGNHHGGFHPTFSLPWGGRFSGPGGFYHPSGLALQWNSVGAQGQPIQTTMNLLTGHMQSQTPWSLLRPNGLMSCQTWDHGTGKSWNWVQNPAGVSAASDQWSHGQDGIQRRNVMLYLPNRTPLHFSDELDPATGKRQLLSDWSRPDAQGRCSRLSIDAQTGKVTRQFHDPQHVPPSGTGAAGASATPAGQSGRPRPPMSQSKTEEVQRAYAAYGLKFGEPVTDEQFARIKSDYRKQVLKCHPDKIKQKPDESAQDFSARLASAEAEFKRISTNYGNIEDEHAFFAGK
ncbi:MAG: hypothetical protein GAK35_02823 [Herbaspirillum frisingense]|uniref:J domain-containing protein n=1 Tax=Herbaspirillum frisingense TaxID=92645 RepID=A0A7V8FVG4_9BURK|nr:MAG: hypothetical protein GAK35_02823 [Herbaspirillum frisingense]